ncbi:unnamed protein product, partial [marine sediment metagenome]
MEISQLTRKVAASTAEEFSNLVKTSVETLIDERRKSDILDELAPDERVDLFEEMPEEMVARFLDIMEKEEARDARELLKYDPSTAGGRMTTDFARVQEGITVEETLDNLRKTAKDLEMVYYVYVLDKDSKLVGVVSLKDLILAEPK